MDCPHCLTGLDEIYTAQGVLVDFCPTCKGTWYDRGELLFFSKHPRQLKRAFICSSHRLAQERSLPKRASPATIRMINPHPTTRRVIFQDRADGFSLAMRRPSRLRVVSSCFLGQAFPLENDRTFSPLLVSPTHQK